MDVFIFSILPKLAGQTSFAYQVEHMRFNQILVRNAEQKGITIREGCSVSAYVSTGEPVSGVEHVDADSATQQVAADSSWTPPATKADSTHACRGCGQGIQSGQLGRGRGASGTAMRNSRARWRRPRDEDGAMLPLLRMSQAGQALRESSHIQAQALYGVDTETELPLFANGLVVSPDGMSWLRPGSEVPERSAT